MYLRRETREQSMLKSLYGLIASKQAASKGDKESQTLKRLDSEKEAYSYEWI